MEFVPNRIKRRIPTEVEGIGKLRPYLEPGKRRSKYITGQTPSTGKLVPSLRAAIEKVGLKDGMTISFHHHLRNGDLVLPQVMAEIAAMGIRDLTLCASSLSKNHTCLIDYIRLGVITGIETSGMRGELAEAISRECILPKPVVFKTHGGRARSIERGERRIDVAFIGASCCDNMGNMNGCLGPSAFGSMGYAKVDARFAKRWWPSPIIWCPIRPTPSASPRRRWTAWCRWSGSATPSLSARGLPVRPGTRWSWPSQTTPVR